MTLWRNATWPTASFGTNFPASKPIADGVFLILGYLFSAGIQPGIFAGLVHWQDEVFPCGLTFHQWTTPYLDGSIELSVASHVLVPFWHNLPTQPDRSGTGDKLVKNQIVLLFRMAAPASIP